MRSAPSNSAACKPSSPSRRRRAPARRSLPAPRRERGRGATTALLRWIGAVVLVTGWLAAGITVAWTAETSGADAVEYRIVDNRVYPVTLAQSRRAQQRVQRMNGDLGLWFAEFDVPLGSLLRPPRLAWTLLVVSTAVGVGFLNLAKLSAEEIDD